MTDRILIYAQNYSMQKNNQNDTKSITIK